ncbi:helix-turn-helix domain-containing protein [Acidiphilium sp.]|uniref:helix-turn-helix domain-containing protein n=1 Tax=Acidiphilium sp. TaxID=527 RepID=UPI0025862F8B|nr:helix-turn-helix domain-containing protein [Acidiphilium sp.]
MGTMNGDHDFDLTIPAPHATVSRGPASVGAELRAVRERLGWKLPDIAARLKIRRVFLEAIEAGNLAALPAPTYAAGFIRSYAEAMGLDPEEILRRFRAEGMTRPRQPDLAFPQPVPDRAVPPGAVLFVVAVIGIAGYFLWYRHSEHELKMARMVPAVPAKLAPLAVPKSPPAPKAAAAPAAPPASSGATPDQLAANGAAAPAASASGPSTSGPSTSSQSASDQSASGQSASGETTSGASASGTSAAGQSAPAAATPDQTASSANAPASLAAGGDTSGTASGGSDGSTTAMSSSASASSATSSSGASSASGGATPGSATPAPATPGAGTATSATAIAGANPLVISASADSWVQVRGPHGTILFSRVLKAGQSWPVPNEPGLTLTTGNAGGTELVRNGAAGSPLGKPGVVLHNIPLTPPASGSATAPSGASTAQ